MREVFPIMTNGRFSIKFEDGYYGLLGVDNEVIIPCVYEKIIWAEDYLLIFNGEKYGVIHITQLTALVYKEYI